MLGVMDKRDRVVEREALLVIVALDMLESREGGSVSGKVAVAGDCSLDDGPEATMGDETEVPAGLELAAACLDAGCVPALLPWPCCVCSLPPPTEARSRLYRPLKPPWTRSIPLGSPTTEGAGGTVKSSKVVRVSEREAVWCIWCSEGCSDARRESPAMARGGGLGAVERRGELRASGGGEASGSRQWRTASGFTGGRSRSEAACEGGLSLAQRKVPGREGRGGRRWGESEKGHFHDKSDDRRRSVQATRIGSKS